MDIEDVTDWESRALAAERELKFRELHHAEVEQENARLEADNARLERALASERREHEVTRNHGRELEREIQTMQTVREGL